MNIKETKIQRVSISLEKFKQLLEKNHDSQFQLIKDAQLSQDNHFCFTRDSTNKINKNENISAPFDGSSKALLIKNIEVNEIVDFSNGGIYTPLIIINSKIKALQIKGSNQIALTDIYIFNCEIGDIKLDNCYLKSLTIEGNIGTINIKLNNCIVKKLSLLNVNCDRLQFTKTSGDSILIYNKCRFNEIHISKESKIKSFDVKDCHIKGSMFLNDSTINKFLINDSEVKGTINVSNLISNSVIISKVSTPQACFENNVEIEELTISNETVIDYLKIQKKCFFETFKLENSQIKKMFSIKSNSKIKKLDINNTTITELSASEVEIFSLDLFYVFMGSSMIFESNIKYFNVFDTSKIGDIVFEKSEISFHLAINQYCSYTITESICKLLHLDNCNIHRFDISMGSKIEAYIRKGQINLVSFDKTSLHKESLISFSDTAFYAIQLESFAMMGNLFFRSIKKANDTFSFWDNIYDFGQSDFHKEVFSNLKNDYKQRSKELTNMFDKPTIRFFHSSLGKTEFSNCQLADFNFEFNNSKITDCFISGGTVPTEEIVIIDENQEPINNKTPDFHGQKAFIYNQFKKIFEAQGDSYRAAQFQAKWAEHQKKYLKSIYKDKKCNFKFTKRVKHFFSELSQDIGIFRLNKLSSNHGESWLKALGITLVGSIILYVIYLTFIGRCFNSNEFDFKLIGYYFEFLNPLHKIDFIYGEQPVWYAKPIDFLGRLFVSYGIYQFIASFRKHGRKK